MNCKHSHITSLFCAMIFTALSSHMANAQDYHWAQPFLAKNLFNPALAAQSRNDVNASLHYRNQWSSITKSYRTIAATFDMKLDNIKSKTWRTLFVGATLYDDKAGDLNYGLFSIKPFAGMDLFRSKDSTHSITIFLAGGIGQRSIQTSMIQTDNQYNGDIFDASAHSGETFDRTSFMYGDISLGFNYSYLFKNSSTLNASISAHHINKPNQSHFNEDISLPINWIYQLEYSRRINVLTIEPYIISFHQKPNQELLFGSLALLSLNESKGNTLSAGTHLSYRLQDAINTGIVVTYNQWTAAITYDINTSTLKRASNGKGGTEISLLYGLKKVKPTKLIPPCRIL